MTIDMIVEKIVNVAYHKLIKAKNIYKCSVAGSCTPATTCLQFGLITGHIKIYGCMKGKILKTVTFQMAFFNM